MDEKEIAWKICAFLSSVCPFPIEADEKQRALFMSLHLLFKKENMN